MTGCGNFQVSHLSVFPYFLPAARVMAHHMAAYTGFGQLPSPVITTEFVSNPAADAYDPSGTQRTGTAFNEPGDGDSSLACVATAICGGAYSGPSYPVQQLTVLPTSSPPGFCWASTGDGGSSQGSFAAPGLAWYTAAGNGSLKLAADSLQPWLYVDSYGAGASPPAAASSLGDTAQARVERLLQAGLAAGPRCIDASQTAILAALDTGGQPCGTSVQNIADSDGALLFVDNVNYVSYWDRAHLAPSSSEPQVTILAPVYSYPPSGFWAAVEAAAPTVQYVIANASSGPGAAPEDLPRISLGHLIVDLAAKRVTRQAPVPAGAGKGTEGTEASDAAGAGAAAKQDDIRLTPTEWHLLEVLLRNPGKLLSRNQLLTEVWGPGYADATGNLRLYMAQLRRKLEPDPARPRWLITEPGMGYRYQPDPDTSG